MFLNFFFVKRNIVEYNSVIIHNFKNAKKTIDTTKPKSVLETEQIVSDSTIIKKLTLKLIIELSPKSLLNWPIHFKYPTWPSNHLVLNHHARHQLSNETVYTLNKNPCNMMKFDSNQLTTGLPNLFLIKDQFYHSC